MNPQQMNSNPEVSNPLPRRISKLRRDLTAHRGQEMHSKVVWPQREKQLLQADCTVIDLTHSDPRILIEIPEDITPQEQPRRGRRMLDGMKRGVRKTKEFFSRHKKEAIGAVALSGALLAGAQLSSAEEHTVGEQAAVTVQESIDKQQAATQEWYEAFNEENPTVSFDTFTVAVQSDEFADMTQWAAENPGENFVIN